MERNLETLVTHHSIEEELCLFKKNNDISHIVGIIGGSNDITPESANMLTEVLFEVQKSVGQFAVQTGGTAGGVPELGVMVAEYLDLPTIGVYPEMGAKYALHGKLDLEIAVPSPLYGDQLWGSETSVFVAIPDIFLLIGGEWGTETEVGMIMKRYDTRKKKDLSLAPLISFENTGKLAGEMESLTHLFRTSEGAFFRAQTSQEVSQIVISHFNINTNN